MKLANPDRRATTEWIGATPDSVPPKAVRARVFARYGGRCYLSGQVIRPGDRWDLEHVKPLAMARPGEILNRENNLAPALKAAHKIKSADEAGPRAKADRLHAKHFGYWPESKAKIPSRGFDKRGRSA